MDRRGQFVDAAERATADAALRDVAKPARHHVEPGAPGRDEVQGEPRMTLQPALHEGALVRAGVVDDQVQGQVRRRLAIEAGQKADELSTAMARQALADDLAVQQAERRKSVVVPCRL